MEIFLVTFGIANIFSIETPYYFMASLVILGLGRKSYPIRMEVPMKLKLGHSINGLVSI